MIMLIYSNTQMPLNAAAAFVLVLLSVWSSLGMYSFCYGDLSDIHCLQSIKNSLEDPFNHLTSWNFNNNTEGFICDFTGVECWHPHENRVLSLQLYNKGLSGNFPLGIVNCKRLVALDLSNNSLSGPIPWNIADLLPYITNLRLSNNQFSGEIPVSLANCSYLNVLKLDHNQLRGSLPNGLGMLSRIIIFSVSNNLLLAGPVPEFLNADITHDNYANNTQLCGGPLEPCSYMKERKLYHDHTFKVFFGIGYVLSFLVVVISYCVHSLERERWMRMRALSIAEKKSKRKQAYKVIKIPTLAQEQIHRFERTVNKMNFTELSKMNYQTSSSSLILNDAIDKYLIGEGFDDEFIQFLEIACNCVQPDPFQRPTMLEVFKTVSTIGQKYGLVILDY